MDEAEFERLRHRMTFISRSMTFSFRLPPVKLTADMERSMEQYRLRMMFPPVIQLAPRWNGYINIADSLGERMVGNQLTHQRELVADAIWQWILNQQRYMVWRQHLSVGELDMLCRHWFEGGGYDDFKKRWERGGE